MAVVQNGRVMRRNLPVSSFPLGRSVPRWAVVVGLLVLGACTSAENLAASSTSGAVTTSTSVTPTTIAGTSTTSGVPVTTAPPVTTAVPVATTVPLTTAPPVTAVPVSVPPVSVPPVTAPPVTAPTVTAPTVTAPTATPAPTTLVQPSKIPPASRGTCAGLASIPADATNVDTIHGDIDGDLHPDAVTSYTTSDGVPHIHATLAFGKQSDVAIPLGFAETVSISFEDFDHSAGASIPPPVAVLAIGAGNAGSAFVTFLTLTTKYCLKQWTLDSAPYSLRISRQGPDTGLSCDGTAGHIHYLQNMAEQQPDGSWTITSQLITHNFTKVTLTDVAPYTVPDGPDIAHRFGDISGCDHAPIFP